MADRIVYDRVWVDGYLSQLKRQEHCLQEIRDNLCQAKGSLLPEQAELYLAAMHNLDLLEQNFQRMRHTVEQFEDSAWKHAMELTAFSEEQIQELPYFM